MSTSPAHKFRVSPFALWRQVSPVWAGTAGAIVIVGWLADKPVTWPLVLRPSFAIAVVVGVLYLLRPIKVNEKGVYGLNRLGLHTFIAWEEISQVTFGRRHPLEPAFRLHRLHGQSVWIPRNTTHLRDLQVLTTKFGGKMNPLAVVLETPLCDAP
jgi:hypothetical protein